MRLDRLRGWGPWFAFASPALTILSFLAFIGILAATHPAPSKTVPASFLVAAGAAVILLALAAFSGLVVALDLEWIEHPLTHTGLTYVALAAAAIGTVCLLGFLIFGPLGLTKAADIATLGMPLGWGVYLIIINLVGVRARLLGRGLAYLGATAGVFELLSVVLGFTLSPAFAVAFIPAGALYMIWSVWLGVYLLRARAPAAVAAPA